MTIKPVNRFEVGKTYYRPLYSDTMRITDAESLSAEIVYLHGLLDSGEVRLFSTNDNPLERGWYELIDDEGIEQVHSASIVGVG